MRYRALAPRNEALKVIKLGMDTRQVVARFEAERQALAMLDHPNIAKVLDAGMTDAPLGSAGCQPAVSPTASRRASASAGTLDSPGVPQAGSPAKQQTGSLRYELLAGSTPFDAKELMASGIDAMRKTIREKEAPRPSTKLTQELVAADVSPQIHHRFGGPNARGSQRRLTLLLGRGVRVRRDRDQYR